MSANEELAAWRAECDKVGIPHAPEMLVRHHRANAGLTAALEMRSDFIEIVKVVREAYVAENVELSRTRAGGVEACNKILDSLRRLDP